MRKTNVCPKCQYNRILLVDEVADSGEYPSDVRPLHIAIAKLGEGMFFDKIGAAGQVSAAVCKRCGYTELYTRAPQDIPVDGVRVREVVGPEPTAPYR